MITDKDKIRIMKILDKEYDSEEIFEMLDAKLEIFCSLSLDNDKLSYGLYFCIEDIKDSLNLLKYKFDKSSI